MRSRLLFSVRSKRVNQKTGEFYARLILTEKAKVTGMDDSFSICFACKIIQARKATTDVCDAEYTAVCSV